LRLADPFAKTRPHVMPNAKLLSLATFAVATVLAACSTTPPPSQATEAAPLATPCPAGVPGGMKCLRGVDTAKAHYLIVVPPQWSGVLVVHAHGGPSLGEPKASRADEDINRWAITVQLGHAWAGSVFRQGGFAVTSAAEDTERVRRIFVDHVAKPRRTLLHGQSWGAAVALKAAELHPRSWDGILLTSGVVAGASTYDFRLDLRVIYQHLCNNHPRPEEPPYALSMGLPKGSTLTRTDLEGRIEACLGLRKPAAQRTPEQARALQVITGVIKVPESAIQGHLNWATWSMQDLVDKVGGASPLGNEQVRYSGSPDDAALNKAVLRYPPDPAAKARFEADLNPKGPVGVPLLTAHGINDATVFVEGHDTLRSRLVAANSGPWLVQTFVDSSEHSYWGDESYPPLFAALLAWVEQGQKPSPRDVAERCRTLAGASAQRCKFVVDYSVKPLASRVQQR
jgi:pimeloyl-ACP methyl ester carboxylesterase